MSGLIFSGVLFVAFEVSEKAIQRKQGKTHVELDQFNLAQQAELTEANVGVRPGNIIVPVSSHYALYGLEAALRRAKCGVAEIVVLHVRMLRRAASGESDLAPDQLFSSIEQLLFTKVLAIAEKRRQAGAPRRSWPQTTCGKAFCAPPRICSRSAVVVGSSPKMPTDQQAREIGMA